MIGDDINFEFMTIPRAVEGILLSVVYMAALINFLYFVSRIVNIWSALSSTRFFTRNETKKGRILPNQEPHVTIQICTFNEGEIVVETLKKACHVDWPKHKLSVQILDDSTDKHSAYIIKRAVAQMRQLGFDAEVLNRPNRVGYKAGSLRHHQKAIKGDFVANMDADHRTEPDFLRKTMPYFFDHHGCSLKEIGMVQVAWGYYNKHENFLTEADALALDQHHVVEQVGRAAKYECFGFNGTGGVWRVETIEAGGGWTWDSVTEDLSLSYHAAMKGYRFRYARDATPQNLEIPSSFQAQMQQKNRWTKGFSQVFRLAYRGILRSPHISWCLKWEAFCHMTCAIRYPCIVANLVLFPILIVFGLDSLFLKVFMALPMVESLLSPFLACYVKVAGSDGSYKTFHSRTSRVGLILPFLAMKVGMCMFESRAFFEGLFENDIVFLTTPKEGGGNSASSSDKIRRNYRDDMCAWAGIALGLYRLVYEVVFEFNFPMLRPADFCLRCLNIVIAVGLFWINGGFLLEKYEATAVGKVAHRVVNWPGILPTIAGLLLLTSRRIGDPTRFLMKRPLDLSSMVCEPAGPYLERAKSRDNMMMMGYSPLIMFAEPRVGSNIVFDFLEGLGDDSPDDDEVQIQALHEIYRDGNPSLNAIRLHRMAMVISSACAPSSENITHHKDVIASTTESNIMKNPQRYMQDLKEQGEGTPVVKHWIEAYEQRMADPLGLLDFVTRIPSRWSSRAYVAMKIFAGSLHQIGMSPFSFASRVHSRYHASKFIVVWRRRMIESFVSHVAAEKRRSIDYSASQLIRVEKDQLESFLEKRRKYYTSVREALVTLQRRSSRGVQWEVFEYDRDLRDRDSLIDTMQRLRSLLDMPHLSSSHNDDLVLDAENLRKQDLRKPLQFRISNWDDVVQWGYAGDVDDWEDLFEGI